MFKNLNPFAKKQIQQPQQTVPGATVPTTVPVEHQSTENVVAEKSKPGFLSKMASSVKETVANQGQVGKESSGANKKLILDINADGIASANQGLKARECSVNVTCEVGRQIKDIINNHLNSANNEYAQAIENYKTNLAANKEAVNSFCKLAAEAETTRAQKLAGEIVLDNALPCIAVINRRITKFAHDENAQIIKINPKAKTFKIRMTDDGKIYERDVSFAFLCIGGKSHAGNDASNCQLNEAAMPNVNENNTTNNANEGEKKEVQAGGSKKKSTKKKRHEDSAVSATSDNICE